MAASDGTRSERHTNREVAPGVDAASGSGGVRDDDDDDELTSERLQVGDEVPNFTCTTQQGRLNLFEYAEDGWLLFFSHPTDFTPVCTSEVVQVQRMVKEFADRKCKVLGLSVEVPTAAGDGIDGESASHAAWLKVIQELHEVRVRFPIVSDRTGDIARQFGMLVPGTSAGLAEDDDPSAGVASRTVLLIDPDKRLQLCMTYPPTSGRNFAEVLRCLDALQLAHDHRVATPANWQVGEDVMILPSVDDAEAAELFPKGFVSIKPFLRISPMPGF